MTARYSIIPSEAFTDRRLKPVDVRVLGVLGGFMGKNAEGWPSQKTIAAAAGLHRATVNLSLRTLVEFGYVRTRERSKSGMKVALHYRIVIDDEERANLVADQAELFPKDQLAPRRKPAKSDVVNGDIYKGQKRGKAQQRQMSSNATSDLSDVGTVGDNDVVTVGDIQRTYPLNIPKDVSSLRTETSGAEVVADAFRQIWQSWPTEGRIRGKRKDLCFEAFVRALGNRQPAMMVEAVRRFVKTLSHPKYAPGLDKWFREGRYEHFIENLERVSTNEPVDWNAAVRRWSEDGYWPSTRLGPAPNQVGYRGPIKPLEDLLPSLGDHPAAREIRSTINLRASA